MKLGPDEERVLQLRRQLHDLHARPRLIAPHEPAVKRIADWEISRWVLFPLPRRYPIGTTHLRYYIK